MPDPQNEAGWLKQIYDGITGAISAGSAIIGKVGIDQTTPGTTNNVAPTGIYRAAGSATLTDGLRGEFPLDSKSNLRVTLISSQSDNPVTTATCAADGVLQTTFGLATRAFAYVFNGSNWDRQTIPNAISRITSAANTTNGTSAKASSGKLHTVEAYNASLTVKYLKIYNKASAPTVGTDIPVLTIAIPPGISIFRSWPNGGLNFATGIAYALTGGAGDADNTALTAGDILGLNLSYS